MSLTEMKKQSKMTRELQDFEVHTRVAAFKALLRRREAEKDIVVAALRWEASKAHDHELAGDALWIACREFNQAELELKAAQFALDERARKR